MGARIYVHPRCCSPDGQEQLVASMESRGFDPSKLAIDSLSHPGRHELVRIVQLGDVAAMYERFDGTRFHRRNGQPAPTPEVA